VVFVQNASVADQESGAAIGRGDDVWLSWETPYSYAIGSVV
jgi:hypothetical protein